MKCPTCESCEYTQYCGATEIMRKCERHNKKVEQTNEEWFCTLSTEEKADKLTDFSFWLVPTIPTEDKREQIRKKIVEWLKQPHRE